MTLTDQFKNNAIIVNQVYWESFRNTFLKGTKLSKNAYNFVYFKNSLMAFGEVIKRWYSQTHYPYPVSLPSLAQNHKYQIFIDVTCFPVGSLIYRLNFFSNQGQIVKSMNFSNQCFEFTFPVEASYYSLELINAGCHELLFKRIQISRCDTPTTFFKDLVINSPIDQQCPQNILLLADGKYLRKLIPSSFSELTNHSLTLANFSWQFQKNLTQKIIELVQPSNEEVVIFSTDERFDVSSAKLHRVCPQITFVSSKQLSAINGNSNLLANNVLKKTVCEPNLDLYLAEVDDYFRK